MSWAKFKKVVNSSFAKPINKKIITPFSREYYEHEFALPGVWTRNFTNIRVLDDQANGGGVLEIGSMVSLNNFDPASGYFFTHGFNVATGSYTARNVGVAAYNPFTKEAFRIGDTVSVGTNYYRSGGWLCVAGNRLWSMFRQAGGSDFYDSGSTLYVQITSRRDNKQPMVMTYDRYVPDSGYYGTEIRLNRMWPTASSFTGTYPTHSWSAGPTVGTHNASPGVGGVAYWDNAIYLSTSLTPDQNRLRRIDNASIGTPVLTSTAADTSVFGMSRRLVAADGKIFALGMAGAPATDQTLRIYNIASDTWASGALAPAGAALTNCYPASYDGKIYCLQPSGVNMWVYNIAANSWTTLAGPGSTLNGAVFVDGYLFTGNHIYNVDKQPSITAVNKGDQILLSTNGRVINVTNTTLQSVMKDRITVVEHDGYLIPNKPVGFFDKREVSGWRLSV